MQLKLQDIYILLHLCVLSRYLKHDYINFNYLSYYYRELFYL